MIKTIAIIAVILIVVALIVVVILASMKPARFRIQRALRIKAAPGKIFALINDFRLWKSWSPYENRDPAMKRTFSGAPSGVGSVYEWDGNSRAGKGRMEITEASEPSRLRIQLDFVRPFVSRNLAEFDMEPDGDASRVTWAMEGPSPFMLKAMSLFIDMDKGIGKDFEAGLENLKRICETGTSS
jgi:hypothetical protein